MSGLQYGGSMKQINTALLLLAFSAVATAETTGPIKVQADRLELDQKQGISLYQGHVRLQRDDTLLQADRLELHSKDGKVTLAIADGEPVHMEMRDPNKNGQTGRAEARHVEYRFDDGLIELQGAAQLWRDGDHFSGERLLYDDKKQQVRAFGNEQTRDRVRVILQPEKEQQ